MRQKTVELQKTFYSNAQYSTFPFFLSDLWNGSARRNVTAALKRYGEQYPEKLLNNPNIKSRLRIFLCGKYIGDPAFDPRTKLQKILNSRMGCEAFLGENIDRKKPRPNMENDLLSIEVEEANRSDLIILFLESFGTAAELTAFVLNKKLVDKVVVLNNITYKGEESFLTQGPIALLEKRDPHRVLYYDPSDLKKGIPIQALRAIDKIVAQRWFEKLEISCASFQDLHPEAINLLLCSYVFFPLREQKLSELLTPYFPKKLKQELLIPLQNRKLIQIDEDFIIPMKSIRALSLPTSLTHNLARVRTHLLGQLILDPAFQKDLNDLKYQAGKLFS